MRPCETYWNRASTERCYVPPMSTLLPPPALEVVLHGLHESEIRCGIQNEPPEGGITVWIDYGRRDREGDLLRDHRWRPAGVARSRSHCGVDARDRVTPFPRRRLIVEPAYSGARSSPQHRSPSRLIRQHGSSPN